MVLKEQCTRCLLPKIKEKTACNKKKKLHLLSRYAHHLLKVFHIKYFFGKIKSLKKKYSISH